jgi:hypothetical protein
MPTQDISKAAPAIRSPPPVRGRKALVVGAALTVLGAVALIVGAVVSSSTGVSQFQRVTVSDQTGTITFNHTGDYVAYYESLIAAAVLAAWPTVNPT